MTAIELINVNKNYGDTVVLKDLNLKITKGGITLIYGESGAGKSTLLNIIGLLENLDSGTLKLFGKNAPKPFSSSSRKLLANNIGYLFQNFALVQNKTVEKNMLIALEQQKGNKKERIGKALKEVGLEGFEKKKISHCSGGEQQRIAFARLLVKPCDIVLCDEPTGSLDKNNKQVIIDLLSRLKDLGKTIVVVTHDVDLKNIADQIIDIKKFNSKHL